MSRFVRFASVCLVALALIPAHAHAHPLIDDAERLSFEAEFEEALAVLAEAEAGSDLTRRDAVRLLSVRALVRFAMDDRDGLARDLRGLASLEPDHSWGPEAPPEITDAFEDARRASSGPLALSVTARPAVAGVWLDAEVLHDAGGLVRDVRLYSRSGGAAFRREGPGARAVAPGARLSYHAELIGPGGAVIASVASRREPETSLPAMLTLEGPREGHGSDFPWLYASLGAGAAILIGVLTGVLVASSNRDEPTAQPTQAPVVIGWD